MHRAGYYLYTLQWAGLHISETGLHISTLVPFTLNECPASTERSANVRIRSRFSFALLERFKNILRTSQSNVLSQLSQCLNSVLSDVLLTWRDQGHVSNFYMYIVDLENFATASRWYTGDIH